MVEAVSPLPGGWKVWLTAGVAVVLLLGALQFGGAVKTWWAKRGIDQAQQEGVKAREDIAAARAEAARLQAEKAAQLREIAELKRQRDRAIAAAARERAEAARLTALADDLARRRREEPRIKTLEEARLAFRQLGYGQP